MPDAVTYELAVLIAMTASCAVSLWAIYGVLYTLWTLARRQAWERSGREPWQ